MNKQILELARRSGATAEDGSKATSVYCFTEQELSEFVELIIKDCVSVMSKTAKEADEKCTYMGDDVPTFVHQYKIKDHFGVK